MPFQNLLIFDAESGDMIGAVPKTEHDHERPDANRPVLQREFVLGYRGSMDPDRARKLLAAERARIERSPAHLERQDTG